MEGIGVLYGYGSRDELIGAGAQHVCATPQAILDYISAGCSRLEPANPIQMPGRRVNLS